MRVYIYIYMYTSRGREIDKVCSLVHISLCGQKASASDKRDDISKYVINNYR